jgi:hypothetical protein
MDIVAALFVENIDLKPAFPGGPTQIDLGGVHFSAVPPSPPPVTVAPHLVVLVRCAQDEAGSGVLEVVFRRQGEQVARNVQPFQVDPGKFTYRLVRAEVDFAGYDTVEAHCRIGEGHVTVVPYSLVPGPDEAPLP